jgi:hypothetical protein
MLRIRHPDLDRLPQPAGLGVVCPPPRAVREVIATLGQTLGH